MGIGSYLRKFAPIFGSRMVLYGILLFVGYIFGFLSNGAIKADQWGWLAVILWLAVAANLLLKAVVWQRVDRGRGGRTLHGAWLAAVVS